MPNIMDQFKSVPHHKTSKLFTILVLATFGYLQALAQPWPATVKINSTVPNQAHVYLQEIHSLSNMVLVVFQVHGTKIQFILVD